MNRAYRTLLFFLCIMVVSCNKKFDRIEIEKINDDIAGFYKYESIVWDGPAFDFNGDGISNTDITKEYANLFECETVYKAHNAGYVGNMVNKTGSHISIGIPSQGLNNSYEQINKRVGVVYHFTPDYTLDNNGRITFCYKYAFPKSVSNYTQGIFLELQSGEVTVLANGRLSFRLKCVYYDYAKDKTISGVLSANMIRTSKLD